MVVNNAQKMRRIFWYVVEREQKITKKLINSFLNLLHPNEKCGIIIFADKALIQPSQAIRMQTQEEPWEYGKK